MRPTSTPLLPALGSARSARPARAEGSRALHASLGAGLQACAEGASLARCSVRALTRPYPRLGASLSADEIGASERAKRAETSSLWICPEFPPYGRFGQADWPAKKKIR